MLERGRPSRAGWWVVVVLASAGLGAGLNGSASHASVWSEGPHRGAQVILDESKHSVTLSIDRDRANVARAVNITLYHADGGKLDLKLKTPDPKEDRVGSRVRFTGTFTPEATSFVGFEIRIPLEDTRATVLRSVDMHRE